MLRIAGIVKESITDGEGLRLVIFAQGCAHKCPGCHNPETHSFEGGYQIEDEEIIDLILKNPLLDGVTFSGGDPLFQAEAFHQLALLIRKKVTPHHPHFTIMAYTGFTFERLLEQRDLYIPLLHEIDVLIDGPFVESERSFDLNFKGSSNQRILDMRETLKTEKPVLYRM
ncbi:anaerobic ribonucleoside-triphosphate reductase activating protein [Proteiniclasticum sp.]|uniref:anaerobic ribonucleoside-triphosphate reductase activating protein n=1 Tax=Proteiniclasticum sp. TaxID=2053595 RepID=UPI00289A8ED1|nr:anaerobic ribonucleoside-triphosphate reductase activating protein [Proteiniclasticum sp.]